MISGFEILYYYIACDLLKLCSDDNTSRRRRIYYYNVILYYSCIIIILFTIASIIWPHVCRDSMAFPKSSSRVIIIYKIQ